MTEMSIQDLGCTSTQQNVRVRSARRKLVVHALDRTAYRLDSAARDGIRRVPRESRKLSVHPRQARGTSCERIRHHVFVNDTAATEKLAVGRKSVDSHCRPG